MRTYVSCCHTDQNSCFSAISTCLHIPAKTIYSILQQRILWHFHLPWLEQFIQTRTWTGFCFTSTLTGWLCGAVELINQALDQAAAVLLVFIDLWKPTREEHHYNYRMNSILRRNPMAYCNWYTWYCNRHSILFQNNKEDDEIIIIVSSLVFLCFSLFSSMSCHPALPALVRGAEAKAKQNKTNYITKTDKFLMISVKHSDTLGVSTMWALWIEHI